MDVGVALPTMAADYTRRTTLDWCELKDVNASAVAAPGTPAYR